MRSIEPGISRFRVWSCDHPGMTEFDFVASLLAMTLSGLAVHIGREPTLEAGLERRNRNRRFARDGNRFAAGGADPHTGHAGALHFRQHQAGLLGRDSHDITRLVLAE